MLANRDQEIIVFKKLSPKDITVTPFKTYKEWNVTTDNSASYGVTIKNGIFDATIGIDCKLDKMTVTEPHSNYIGIKRAFYDADKFNPHITTGRCAEFKQTRELNGNIKIISIPELAFGEQIKPGSVQLYQGNSGYTYYDDMDGNLIYTPYTSSLVSFDMLSSYINFNELYYLLPNQLYSGSINDNWNIRNTVTASNVIAETGMYGTGISLNSDTSYVQINHIDELDFSLYDNYTLSFWLKVSATQSYTGHTEIVTKYGNNSYAGMPYRVYYDSSDKLLKYEMSDTIVTQTVTSSATINDDTYHHIVCQKSGSFMNLYIDGTLDGSLPYTGTGDIHNTSDVFIGTNGTLSKFISASIDEFRIYRRILTSTEITNLYSLPSNSARVGNVLYEYGKIILTHPSSSFTNLYGDFNLYFKGQHTIYEREIICNIKDTEYNYSMNDTLRLTQRPSDDRIKPFATGSDFSPYITTIGLYNDRQELLAVAKLARPLKSEKNSDLTIVVRIDM